MKNSLSLIAIIIGGILMTIPCVIDINELLSMTIGVSGAFLIVSACLYDIDKRKQKRLKAKQAEIETKWQKVKIQNDRNASLSIAVSYGDTEEVKRLLNAGADPYSVEAVYIIHAAKSGYYDTLKLILDSQKSKIDKCVQ